MSRLLLSSLKLSHLKLSYASVLSQHQTFLKSALPCVNCIAQRNYARPAVAERSYDNVDAKINKLDQTVKRLGRTTLREVEGTLREIEAAGSISVTQSLMMIRSCGSLLVEVKPNSRTELAHRIWKLLEDLRVKLDISHYNALLRVYLENDFSFAPSDILSDIEKIGLEPNRVTCQRLINRYCQMGDIAGATRILQFMREKGMPINESVFNALISGHSRVNDMESAEGTLTVMKEGGIEPSSETYTLLMCGYIKNGNLAKVEELFRQCETQDIIFTDRDYFDIIYAYTMHGHEDEVDKILSKIRKSATYNHDAMNFTFKLLTADKPEVAFKILKSMLRATRPDGSILPSGNFLIAHLIRNNAPTDLVIKYCRELMNENLNPGALSIALENAVRCGKEATALDLFKEAKKDDAVPIRQHYFWPLLINRGRRGDINGMCELLHTMNHEFGLPPDSETIRDYVIPYMLERETDVSKILLELKGCGIQTAQTAGNLVHYLVDHNEMKKAVEVANGFSTRYALRAFRGSLTAAFLRTLDVESFVALLSDFRSNLYLSSIREAENEAEAPKVDHRDFVSETIDYIARKLITAGRKDVLEDLLRKLLEAKIGVSESKVQAIQARVKNELPSDLVSSLEKLASEEFATPAIRSKTSKFSMSSMDHGSIERLYESSKESGKQPSPLLKRLLFAGYAKGQDVEKMMKLKEELEVDGFTLNTTLQVFELDAYVKNGKFEEALQLYQKLCDAEPNFTLNPTKTLNLVDLLVEHEQYDKAYEILNKRRDCVAPNDETLKYHVTHRTGTAHKILCTLADRGLVDKVKEVLDLMLSNKFVERTPFLLSPLIRSHIKRGDYEAAMKEFENCVNTYKMAPMKNELALHFIEKEDTANLQKLTDLNTQIHGETNALADLMFAFLESGRVKQAKKILETPGFRLRPDRLEHFVEKGSPDHIMNLLKVTKGIPLIDRALIYEKLLSSYVKSNDAQNSLSLWMEIQEEDLQPTDAFLIDLSDLLQANNMTIPFIVPDAKARSTKKINEAGGFRRRARIPSKSPSEISKLVKSGDLDGALAFIESRRFVHRNDCSKLVEALLQNNRYEDAKRCFLNFLKKYNSVVDKTVFQFLLKHASENGDINLFTEIEGILKTEFKMKTRFDSWWATAYQKAGRAEEYISSWEVGLSKIKNKEELNEYLNRFPLRSVLNIMNENPAYIPRLETFTQKCLDIDSAHGKLPSLLFNFYMMKKDYEAAEKIWEKYLKNARRVYFRNILGSVHRNLDTELGSKLLPYVKDLPVVLPNDLAEVYRAIIHAHVERNEVEEAKKYFDEALGKLSIELFDIMTLESLKSACSDKGIAFPHDIPVENERKKVDAGSSSDSESD